MKYIKKLLCALIICTMLTPTAALAEYNEASDIQLFSIDKKDSIESFSDGIAITEEENKAIQYFVKQAIQREASINFEEYSMTYSRFSELYNYIFLSNPELYIVTGINLITSDNADNSVISAIYLSYCPEEEEELVSYLAEGMRNRQERIEISPKYTITYERFLALFNSISASDGAYKSYLEKYYPELFYIIDFRVEQNNHENNNYVKSVSFSYNVPVSKKEQEMLHAIVDGLSEHCSTITLKASDYGITDYERYYYVAGNCLTSLIQNEHPELFYVNTYGIRFGASLLNGKADTLYVYAEGTFNEGTDKEFTVNAYTMNQETVSEKQALINAEYEKIQALITRDMTPLQKVLTVHDYIASNYEYDTSYQVRTLDSMVEQKKGVCQGYSYLFKFVLNRLGIECVTVPSTARNHMWNKVMLDGEWYNIDITHDDPIPNGSANISHTHFLVNDDDMKLLDDDHTFYNQYKWDGDTPAEVSDGSAFSDSALQTISSQAIYADDTFYCFDSENNLCSIDFDRNSTVLSPLYTESSDYAWKYMGSYSSVVLYRDDIYFNSPTAVFKYDSNTQTAEEVFRYEEDNPDIMIYGLTVKDDTLYIEYADNINYGFELAPVMLSHKMTCSSDIQSNPETGEVTVTLSIPDEVKEKVMVMIAEFDENGILIGFAEREENQNTVTFKPDEECKSIKSFIWSICHSPLSTADSFTVPESANADNSENADTGSDNTDNSSENADTGSDNTDNSSENADNGSDNTDNSSDNSDNNSDNSDNGNKMPPKDL